MEAVGVNRQELESRVKDVYRMVATEENRQYGFLSRSAQGATKEYGVKSISLLARHVA